MKTRGLRKSLNFLERLHTSVLRKARLTLEKSDYEGYDSATEEYEGDKELRRYGVWSNEARELNLPSYRCLDIFIICTKRFVISLTLSTLILIIVF